MCSEAIKCTIENFKRGGGKQERGRRGGEGGGKESRKDDPHKNRTARFARITSSTSEICAHYFERKIHFVFAFIQMRDEVHLCETILRY